MLTQINTISAREVSLWRGGGWLCETSRGNYDDRLVRELIKIGGLLLNPYDQTHEMTVIEELCILKFPTKKINQHTFGFVQTNAFKSVFISTDHHTLSHVILLSWNGSTRSALD